ncbi:hypothetical protein ACAX43_14030 [Paraburkholderia sp. IW21]|uniref:hypothetical protein n=1 Tax=Paraburkholderia sp. IW21 TaxID=3242488 RepID=UPI0035207168
MSSPKDAALAFRDELLANRWPDDTRVAELIGVPGGQDAVGHIRDLLISGALLGVWSDAQHRYVYPWFQFDSNGALLPEISSLLENLPGLDDGGGWRRAFWLYSPHALLDGGLPAEVFITDPIRVIEVARREFNRDPDAGW